jgi:POT family proton-dependent oligopeptide transporter
MEKATARQHLKQPKVIYLSFITAMCERYGYYIIGFLLTLYVKNVYNFSDAEAFTAFGLFTALGYLTPAIGGYLADHHIGIKRCLGLGLALEGLGYALLALPTPNHTVFYTALGAIIVGAGIFKTAPTNILGRAYAGDDPRIDSGFTLYYMGINIGSLTSAIVAGSIQRAYGWNAPFLFATAGLLLGFIWFVFFKHHARDLESEAGKRHFHVKKWVLTMLATAASVAIFAYLMSNELVANICFYAGSAALLLYFIYEIVISPADERVKILVCLALMFMAVVFFLLYFQLYTSMDLFIERIIDRDVLGFRIPTVYFLGLNGFWIIVLSPIYAWGYKTLNRSGKRVAITTKFPMGILLIAACFFSLTIACHHFARPDSKISFMWMVFALFLYSAGELLTSALGVAMITRIAPTRMYGVMMGSWYLIAFALAANLSGYVARLASIPAELQHNLQAMLGIYSTAFWKMGLIGLAVAILGFAISPWLKKKAGLT